MVHISGRVLLGALSAYDCVLPAAYKCAPPQPCQNHRVNKRGKLPVSSWRTNQAGHPGQLLRDARPSNSSPKTAFVHKGPLNAKRMPSTPWDIQPNHISNTHAGPSPVGTLRTAAACQKGRGGWHKALVVGSASLWRRLLAFRP